MLHRWFLIGSVGAALLLCSFFGFAADIISPKESRLSPQWTERYLYKNYPQLLKNSHTDHVLAFYYFGGAEGYTVMGMERIKGDDYLPHLTVLIFKDLTLQGYYPEVGVFPSGVSELAVLSFPANASVSERVQLSRGAKHYPEIHFLEGAVQFVTVVTNSDG